MRVHQELWAIMVQLWINNQLCICIYGFGNNVPTCMAIIYVCTCIYHLPNACEETPQLCLSVQKPLFHRSNCHGSGCTAALSAIHCFLYRVYCLTPPTSLCSDNTQNMHRSTVEWIPKQRPHPRLKGDVLATHLTLLSQPMGWVSKILLK